MRLGRRRKHLALLTYSRQQLPIPDAGSLRGDLIAVADSLAAYLATPFGKALARSRSARGDDPALAENREQF